MSRMIRPCDTCGGDGWPMSDDGHKWMDRPCPRCLDMPWLAWREFRPWLEAGNSTPYLAELALREGYQRRDVKPDRDTVMRWCFTHNDRPECKVWGQARPCVIGWVERPTRLDEAG